MADNNSPSPPQPTIGHVFLARIWLFQAVVAAPTFVVLGMLAIVNLYNTYDTIYDFVTHLCTAILAAAIIFVVLVQKQLPGAGKALTFRFEVAKSALATALWLWLMGDAIWGPISHGGYRRDRTMRIVSSAISSILLL